MNNRLWMVPVALLALWVIVLQAQCELLRIRMNELQQYAMKAQMACAYVENVDWELECVRLELDKVGSWANGQYFGVRYRPSFPDPMDPNRAIKYPSIKLKTRAPKGYEELAK